jgi:hypothetical protein
LRTAEDFLDRVFRISMFSHPASKTGPSSHALGMGSWSVWEKVAVLRRENRDRPRFGRSCARRNPDMGSCENFPQAGRGGTRRFTARGPPGHAGPARSAVEGEQYDLEDSTLRDRGDPGLRPVPGRSRRQPGPGPQLRRHLGMAPGPLVAGHLLVGGRARVAGTGASLTEGDWASGEEWAGPRSKWLHEPWLPKRCYDLGSPLHELRRSGIRPGSERLGSFVGTRFLPQATEILLQTSAGS